MRTEALGAGTNEVVSAVADDNTFAAWYYRTYPAVFSYLIARCGRDPELAEELAQHTYVAAIQHRWRFEGRSDVTTWLCGIARHKLLDHYRRAERDERRRLRIDVAAIPNEAPEASLDSAEREVVAAAFRSLPAAQRAALMLVSIEGLSVSEAAGVLGRTTGATEALLHRARERFRRAYREESAHG